MLTNIKLEIIRVLKDVKQPGVRLALYLLIVAVITLSVMYSTEKNHLEENYNQRIKQMEKIDSLRQEKLHKYDSLFNYMYYKGVRLQERLDDVLKENESIKKENSLILNKLRR